MAAMAAAMAVARVEERAVAMVAAMAVARVE